MKNGLEQKRSIFSELFGDVFWGMFEEGSRSLGPKGSAEGAGPVGDSFEQFVIDFGGVRGLIFGWFWKFAKWS